MGSLTLSSRHVAQFVALQDALLSPLACATIEEWCAVVLRRTEALFSADRSAMFIPTGERIHYVSESIDPRSLQAFQSGIAEMRPGALRFTEALVDRAWQMRRSLGIEVWSIPMLERLTGIPMEQVPMYHEAVKPAGLVHSAVATAPVPAGEAFLGVSHSRPADDPFGDARLHLMEMLVPAFKAGIHVLLHVGEAPAALGRTLDALGEALLVADPAGREVHRSGRLTKLLSADPERARVLGEMRSLARSLAEPRTAGAAAAALPRGTRAVRTGTAHYRVHGCYGPRTFGGGDAVFVTLERVTPELPAPQELIERHGLTRREAEVAVLLALGLSNHEIATRLSVSPCTVRHHAEWIFTKMGIHSRKALALRLMNERV